MKRHHQYWVYMLQCSDGTFYSGVTNNIERRFVEHQNGLHVESYTFTRRPLRLVYASEFQYVQDAISAEKRLKKWSRAKKKAVVDDRLELLPDLARKSFSIRSAAAELLEVTQLSYLLFCVSSNSSSGSCDRVDVSVRVA
ncbi:GIY-YIG nuclease family protein [Candidatus Peribacteria bacterium]|nr:GIY-YIG nuclease family protein [Candidatus Peribacteria bacterium]